ncbi:MAG: transcription antitermination factor NusB [Thiotrichaceae bacterium]|nr:transcription antitermination factor NusB [Thiotrichaceae bacterium]
MRKRTLARECSLKILYQAEITRREIHLAADNYWEDNDLRDKVIHEFSQIIYQGIQKNFQDIDTKISEYATNWQLNRMAVIDRNILRIGVFELLYLPEVPPKVTINEAVELAKKYGDMDSSKFVNGVLDKIHKDEFKK